jgi:hypothetical protein
MKPSFSGAVGTAMVLMAGMMAVAAQDHPGSGQAASPVPVTTVPVTGMGDHIEGRIAFLKAELKITDAQLPQWNAFADALRSNAKRRAEMLKTPVSTTAPTAIDHLDRIEKTMTGMAEMARSTKAALGPLYAVLSDDQKKMADSLLREPMMGGGL